MASASFSSVAEIFLHRVASTPDTEAFSYPEPGSHGEGGGERWHTMKWRDVGERVQHIALGLAELGLESEERVALLCATRVEWLLADLGVLCSGGATTTIYPSSTADECAFILRDSGSAYVIAENADQLAKLQQVRDQLPQVRKVVVIDAKGVPTDDAWVLTLGALEKLGRTRHQSAPDEFESRAKAVRPEHLATLIYTSGTTGTPKGVELTHDCWVFESESMDSLGLMSPADKQFLWLPLAHSFGKVLQVALIRIGIPTAVDGRVDRIVDNLAVVRPTIVAAVPRIFEKVYNKVVSGARDGGAAKWRIFQWSLDIGRQVSQLRQRGNSPRGALAVKHALADKLVFSKLRERFGGRIRFFISGSAPLNREIAEFFHAAGLLVLEGYGLTETSAASFVNRPEQNRFGTVGLAMPGVRVRIAQEDGEILLGGRGVMRGYHGLPEVNAETFEIHTDPATGEDQRWLKTGDIGEIDADGFLKITDRKKDLIKTSGGKYVAPQALEGKLKAACTYVSHAIVHGNARNFCTALIALDPEAITAWAADNGLSGKSMAQLSTEPKVHALIQGYVDQVNRGEPSYATIKKFAVLPKDLTQEDGFLTPSLKVKRKAVEAAYKDLLDGFYEGAVAAI